jgi:hypothetical protein
VIHILGYFPVSQLKNDAKFCKLVLLPSSDETVQPHQLGISKKATLDHPDNNNAYSHGIKTDQVWEINCYQLLKILN